MYLWNIIPTNQGILQRSPFNQSYITHFLHLREHNKQRHKIIWIKAEKDILNVHISFVSEEFPWVHWPRKFTLQENSILERKKLDMTWTNSLRGETTRPILTFFLSSGQTPLFYYMAFNKTNSSNLLFWFPTHLSLGWILYSL